MQFLDRSGRARVVATAVDDRQLVEAVRQLTPDAVVAQPGADRPRRPSRLDDPGPRHPRIGRVAPPCDPVGAGGYFLWPGDRDAARHGPRRRDGPVVGARSPPGVVVAVHGARGGVGVTFVATHLAAAFARRGSCSVLDADPLYGDVSAAVGMPQDGPHPRRPRAAGGRVDDGPVSRKRSGRTPRVRCACRSGARTGGRRRARSVVARRRIAAADGADVVLVHLPRALDACARGGLRAADRVIEVLSLDVLSFRAATRALEAFDPIGMRGPVGFVVNRPPRARSRSGT